jgi:hypothetical protein
MSHLTIVFILVLTISIIITFLVIMHNNQLKARKNSILSFFKNAGIVHNLSFTGQEVLQDKVLGLDGPNRKLLITEEQAEEYKTRVIDLREIAACTVKKVYGAINSREYKRNKPEEFLKSIALEFEFTTGGAPMAVHFYRNTINSIYEIPELEGRAKNWAKMLSNLTVSS